MILTKDTKVVKETQTKFYVETGKKRFVFKELDIAIDTWIKNLNSVISQLKQ